MDILTLIKRHQEIAARSISYPSDFANFDSLILLIASTEEHIFDLLDMENVITEEVVSRKLSTQTRSDIPQQIQTMEQEFLKIEAALAKVQEVLFWNREQSPAQHEGLHLVSHWTHIVAQQGYIVQQSSEAALKHFKAFRKVCLLRIRTMAIELIRQACRRAT